MSKVKVTTVNGPAEYNSWQGQDGKTRESWEVPCTGTINGNPGTFKVKVFSKWNVEKVKPGLEGEVEGRDSQGVTSFSFKKDNFPQTGGGWSGGRGYTPRNSVAEESAKYPAFALAYANQYRIARESFEGREMTTEQTFVVANAYLTWLQSSTPKQAEAPAPTQSAPQSQPAQQSQPQAPDLNSLLWTKLAKLQLADRCRAAGVDFTMLQIWWSESNESDLAFASRIKAELQKAGV